MANNIAFTTPVGRLVKGNLYKPNLTDAENKPLVTKTGPNAGQPRVDFFFALAIAKTAGRNWWEEEWGQKIMGVGATAFPQAYMSPSFAWKVADGDSTIPNKKGKRNCDRPGHAGCWILSFSSGFAPEIYKQRDGTSGPNAQFDALPQPDFIKLGYYVQVKVDCAGNGSQTQPGVFLNHRMVCFSAFGDIISVGPDVSTAGFGQGALPAGASMTPPAGAFAAAAPGMMAVPGMPQMGAPAGLPQMPGMGMPQMGAPAGMPQMPGMAAPPMMQAAAPATPQYQMLPAAGGHSREQWNAQGYNDAALVAAGFMVPAPSAPAGLPQMPGMGMPQMGAPAGMPQMPGMAAPGPLAPGFSAPGAGGYAAPIAGAPGAPIPVIPNAQFVQFPAQAGMAPGMPQMGAPQMMAPAGPQVTPKAQQVGFTSWQHLQSQGWDEPNARAHGYIA